MKIKISDLLDGYEETRIELEPVTWVSEEAIHSRVFQHLRGEPRGHRPLSLVLIAAALVTVLCGASAIIHYVTLGKSEHYEVTRTEPFRMPSGEIIADAEQEFTYVAAAGRNSVRIERAKAGDAPTWVGVRPGWLPDGAGEPLASSLLEQLAYNADPGLQETAMKDEALDSIYVYLGSKVSSEYYGPDTLGNHYYSIQVFSSAAVEGAEFLLFGGDAEIVKEDTLGQYQAIWINVRRDVSDTETADFEDTHYLLLYDEVTSSLISIAGGLDFSVYEAIAEQLELVVTDIPAEKSDQLPFHYLGGLG